MRARDIRWHTRPRHLLGLCRVARRRAGLWQFRTAPIVTREHGNDRVVLLCVAGAARRRGRARGCEDVGPMSAPKFGTGQPVRRKEDDALLRGAGRYVADHAPPGCLHAVVLRSPHAHARFHITDVAKARAMPGIALVLIGADTAALGNLPCQGQVPGCTIDVPPYPILARDEVRHVGDAVAFVVADTLDRARDAAESIVIDWEPLPAVIGAIRALAPDAPKVW